MAIIGSGSSWAARAARPLFGRRGLRLSLLQMLPPPMMATKGLSLELEHPQYFVDGRGSLQAKKGR